MKLHEAFTSIPLAHRCMHDLADGRPENSLEAASAAIALGYGMEVDLQLSSDGEAMVFHDYHLGRVTDASGPFALRSADELGQIRLNGGESTIPTLKQFLDLIAGRVPLLIEIKDQDGAMGPNVDALERATARALSGYNGPVAVMSFNPHSIAAFGDAAPQIPRGITTGSFSAEDYPALAANVRQNLLDIPDYDAVGASFISHQATDLTRKRVSELKAQGADILCWKIQSPEQEAEARKVAHGITFEGYFPTVVNR